MIATIFNLPKQALVQIAQASASVPVLPRDGPREKRREQS
jgi:hypothetical protein